MGEKRMDILSMLGGLANFMKGKTTDQRNLTGLYTKDPFNRNTAPMALENPSQQDTVRLEEFLGQKNPHLLKAYLSGQVTPSEAYQIATQGNVPGWGKQAEDMENQKVDQENRKKYGTSGNNFGTGWK